jgi:hypothetical protein
MRYYEQALPDAEEIVMCQVRQIAEMGAYVKLLEYDGAEGMILLSELSRRRIRSIQKLIRVGRNEVVVVLRVDKDKGESGRRGAGRRVGGGSERLEAMGGMQLGRWEGPMGGGRLLSERRSGLRRDFAARRSVSMECPSSLPCLPCRWLSSAHDGAT